MAVLKREEAAHASADVNVHDVHTILGPESAFEGKLVFDGTVRIDGKFKGEIHTDNTLVVGQGAHVEAQIHVGHIIINGEVIGDVFAKQSIEIHAPAKVRGTLQSPQLMISKGVVFEGTSKMEDAIKSRADSAQGAAKVTLLPPVKEGEKR
jgi:cytoskeletal protein CcmA (bactofilin family)